MAREHGCQSPARRARAGLDAVSSGCAPALSARLLCLDHLRLRRSVGLGAIEPEQIDCREQRIDLLTQ